MKTTRNKNLPIVYIDSDGVLADWVGAVHEWTGVPRQTWTTWGHYKALGITDEQLNDIMSYVSFWSEIQPLKKGLELFKALSAALPPENLIVATSPFPHGNCLFGKDKWFQKHLKLDAKRVIYVGDKGLLARQDAVLIDDGLHQIEPFTANGGLGILYQRPWNHSDPDQSVEDILRTISAKFPAFSPK